MKVDRTNPAHWQYLFAFSANVACSLLLRPFARHRDQYVVLYGHKLNGNLLTVYKELSRRPCREMEVVFLTLDPDYAKELRAEGVNVVCAIEPRAAFLLARTAAMITDHGLHVMEPLLWLTQIRFIDVWHGIPFKGFDAEDFRVQRRYDETWVASPFLAELYVRKFGFDRERVVTTGYARTDRLARRDEDVLELRKQIGAPAHGPLILFAPTWVQDHKGRSLYPFGCSQSDFLLALSEVASRHKGTVLMRPHLNSGRVGEGLPNIVAIPQSRFPDTEAVLLTADLLICDWSSIAFDFLLLDRPAIFLDVPAPFRKGFSLGPEYRYGPVVRSLDDLTLGLDQVLSDPDAYRQEYMPKHRKVRREVYGDFADGHSAQRCADRLISYLVKGESSR